MKKKISIKATIEKKNNLITHKLKSIWVIDIEKRILRHVSKAFIEARIVTVNKDFFVLEKKFKIIENKKEKQQ